MKKSLFLKIFACLIALVILAQGVVVEAYSQAVLRSLINNTYWYDPTCAITDASIGGQGTGKAYLLGDSVAAGAKSEIMASLTAKGFQLNGDESVNAISSRTLTEGSAPTNGLSVLAADKSIWEEASTVIIALGTNSSGLNPDNIKKAVDIVRPGGTGPNIYWVNVGADNSKRNGTPINVEAINSTIQASSTLGYKVIDWASEVATHPDYIDENPATGLGVHLSEAGKKPYADIVANGATGAPTGVNPAPSTGSAACCSQGSSNVQAGDIEQNKKSIFQYLLSKGLKPFMAAGIMANLQAESGFNPRRVQSTKTPEGDRDNITVDGHTGYGLAQWTTRGRQQGLADAAAAAGKPSGDLGVQLDYLWTELNGGYKGSVLDPLLAISETDPIALQTATWLVLEKYEAPADIPGNRPVRLGFAQDILSALGGLTGGVIGTSSNCGSGGSAVAGNIVATAINYAWPEKGHGLTPKPEYAAAIQQYNPTAPYGGADCGSFVGVVMISSGADPNYPKQQTKAQEDYVRAHPELYDIAENVEVADLLPGDILIVNKGNGLNSNGHTFIFLGDQPTGNNAASASGGHRMPNQDKAYTHDERGNYIRVRLKSGAIN